MEKNIIDMIQKYEVSGPRYTSYPPAPLFTQDFGGEDYRQELLYMKQHRSDNSLSLYVHVPFCDTLCYFCGCTTVVTQNRDKIDEYLGYLMKEIDMLASHLHSEKKVVQMHWGGGTPTYLSPSQIQMLGSHIRRAFKFDDKAEISAEVDPRGLTYNHLKTLREIGFNRISLGVQDFNPKVQFAVNRNQSEFLTRQVIDWSRDLGFGSLNIDLIYGLPMQTAASFNETLQKVIEISPDRIAVYNFAYVPWIKKHQRLIHIEDLPSPETKLELLVSTIDELSAAGYVYIGMDHFAKPDDELTVAQRTKTLHRNFQGYSTKAGSDLHGLGMSAISHFGTTYAQNAKTLPEYYQAITAGKFATHAGYRMTLDDQIRKFVIMRLMCDLALNKDEVEGRLGVPFEDYFSSSMEKLQPLIEDELIISTPFYLIVSETGRLFLRNIAMCFDAYLPKSLQQPIYSKTI